MSFKIERTIIDDDKISMRLADGPQSIDIVVDAETLVIGPATELSSVRLDRFPVAQVQLSALNHVIIAIEAVRHRLAFAK